MRRAVVALLLLCACREPGQPSAPATPPREWLNDEVYAVPDAKRGVVCYVVTNRPAADRSALSCLRLDAERGVKP
jgi:hypothetical protein